MDEGVAQVLRLKTELLHGKSEETIKNHCFASLRPAVTVLGSLAYLRNSSKIFGWFCSVLCELNHTVWMILVDPSDRMNICKRTCLIWKKCQIYNKPLRMEKLKKGVVSPTSPSRLCKDKCEGGWCWWQEHRGGSRTCSHGWERGWGGSFGQLLGLPSLSLASPSCALWSFEESKT